MKKWNDRPNEIRALFNPAFCGMSLLGAIQSYEKIDDTGIPFSQILLILPLSLHKRSRDVLLSRPRTRMLQVVESFPELLIGLPERTRNMLPFTLEGLGLLWEYGCINITDSGRIKRVKRRLKPNSIITDETQACMKCAVILGRHFARVSDSTTIYTSLGIRP